MRMTLRRPVRLTASALLVAGVIALAVGGLTASATAAKVASNSGSAASAKSDLLVGVSDLGGGCGDFCVELMASIKGAFHAAGYDNVFFVNNNENANTTVENARIMVSKHVKLYVDMDGGITNYKVTLALMKKNHIPLILLAGGPPAGSPADVAWENGNRPQAGVLAGNTFVSYAKKHWGGHIDGLFATWESSWDPADKKGITNMLPIVNKGLHVHYTTSSGMTLYNSTTTDTATEAAATAFLNAHPNDHHLIFYTATSDTDAQAVETALKEAGRLKDAIIYSIGGSTEGDQLLCAARAGEGDIVGDVNFLPGKWGPGLVTVAEKMLAGRRVPPIIYPPLSVLTPANVTKSFHC